MKHHKIQQSRKHKKVKNFEPFFYGARTTLTGDLPPDKVDEQEIPRKVLELRKPRVRAKGPDSEGAKRPMKTIPEMKRKKGETDRQYLNRVYNETETVIDKTMTESKYGIDLDLLAEGKETPAEAPVFDKEMREMARKIVKKKKKIEDKVLNTPKKVEKKKKKKRLDQDAAGVSQPPKSVKDFSTLRKDNVKFGEVNEAPPTLTAFPRKAEQKHNRSSLLLNKLFNPNASSSKEGAPSAARKQMLEAERVRVVDAYRQMKQRRIDERQNKSKT